uniref:Uncharacterized protein n=1 Tax=Entomoneis paludosa TaxID=265537 RepID=A0A7S3DN41_9STRA
MAARSNYKILSKDDNQEEVIGATTTVAEWSDRFYEKEQDIVRVFDYDYTGMQNLARQRSAMFLMIMCVYLLFYNLLLMKHWYDIIATFIGIMIGAGIVLCCTRKRRKQLMEAIDGGTHTALTTRGIRKDLRNFPFGNMFHTTLFIPYDEIKSIEIRKKGCSATSCCKVDGPTDIVDIRNNLDETVTSFEGMIDSEGFVAAVKEFMMESPVAVVAQVLEDTEEEIKKEEN